MWGAQAIAARELARGERVCPVEYLESIAQRSKGICPEINLKRLRKRFQDILGKSKKKEIPLKKLVDTEAQALVDLVKKATGVTCTATTFVSLGLSTDFQRSAYQQGDSLVYTRSQGRPMFSTPHTLYELMIGQRQIYNGDEFLFSNMKNAITAGLGQCKSGATLLNKDVAEVNGTFQVGDIYGLGTDGALACGERIFDQIASDLDISCVEAVGYILDQSAGRTRDNQTLFLGRVLEE
ncbi:hypothetical protein CL619_05040 [archaeon]|nr:hypothetical protein [archaeon]